MNMQGEGRHGIYVCIHQRSYVCGCVSVFDLSIDIANVNPEK
jgi:hypothetical protein